jgi:hypoxanthine phosphoribosyltransferase
VKAGLSVVHSRQELAARVTQMGRAITRDYAGRSLDIVVILENAFIFAADLVRAIDCPAICHFVRVEMRDLQFEGFDRREIFFSNHPNLENRDVLLVDAVLHSGVLQDFLLKRLQDSRPRSMRLAVLLDKPHERKVDLKADYFGFAAASKYLVGYGLPASQGYHRNLPFVALPEGTPEPAGLARRGTRRKQAELARKVR